MKKNFTVLIWFVMTSCTKNIDEVPLLTSDLTIGTNIMINMPVYPTLTYLRQYSTASIPHVNDVVGYLVPTSNIGIQIYVLYNKTNGYTSKLIYKSYRRFDLSYRNQIYSMDGVLMFSIDIKKRYISSDTAYNVVIGTMPLITLGSYTLPPGDPLLCNRRAGFNECYKCARDDCHDKWYCDAGCALAHGACQAGWIVSCAIMNIPHGPTAGGRLGDTTLRKIYRLPMDITLNKLN